MPAPVTDPKLLATIREQGQVLQLLADTIKSLDARQKNLEHDIARTVGGLERSWKSAADTLAARDVALAQLEAQIIAQLSTIIERLPPNDGGAGALQTSVERLIEVVEQTITGQDSALNSQRQAFNMLRASLVEHGQADRTAAYQTTLQVREAGK